MNIPSVTRVVTADQMRAMDLAATEKYGIPSLILMENAGRAVFQAAVDLLDGIKGKDILIACGPGNNGGDGFVVARHLHNAGAFPVIAYFGDREKAKGDALTNLAICEKIGLEIIYNPIIDSFWHNAQHRFDLLIDALLGTGAKGELREPFTQIIPVINGAKWKVISVDIPSGIDADTGQLMGCPVQADVTVTFAYPKIGLLSYPGKSWVGKLVIVDIGIPLGDPLKYDIKAFLLDWTQAFALGTPSKADTHKGDLGHVAIIAGSVGMTGAATLAAQGALRIGTGLVTVVVPESLNDIMEVKLTEAMTIPVPEGNTRAFGMASLDKVLEIIEKRDAAVIGPGFGRDEDTIEFTLELIKRLNKTSLIDADGLFAISRDLSVLKKCKAPLVLTPHPGEMATLLGTTSDEVQSNRLDIARLFAERNGVTVVLKGAATVVAGPDGKAFINTTGTPGMATGGTGDVLSGMIGGVLARGWNPCSVARSCVYIHGRAGEMAASDLGESSMLASDILKYTNSAISETFSKFSNNTDIIRVPSFGALSKESSFRIDDCYRESESDAKE